MNMNNEKRRLQQPDVSAVTGRALDRGYRKLTVIAIQ